MKTTAGLTPSEEMQLVSLLGKVEQPWSSLFYNAIARKLPAITIEAVCLAPGSHAVETEVLLIRRPSHDAHFANMVHSPGTLLRQTDTTIADALKRVIEQELKSSFLVPADFKPAPNNPTVCITARGNEVPLVFYTKILDDRKLELEATSGGTFTRFYPELPSTLIPHHSLVVRAAIKALERNYSWE